MRMGACMGVCMGVCMACGHRPQPLSAHALGNVHLLEELVARHAQVLDLLRVLFLSHPLCLQALLLWKLRMELHVRYPLTLACAVLAFNAADKQHVLQRDDLQLRVVRLGALGSRGAQRDDEGAAAKGHERASRVPRRSLLLFGRGVYRGTGIHQQAKVCSFIWRFPDFPTLRGGFSQGILGLPPNLALI